MEYCLHFEETEGKRNSEKPLLPLPTPSLLLVCVHMRVRVPSGKPSIFCGSCAEDVTYTLIPSAWDTGTEGCNWDYCTTTAVLCAVVNPAELGEDQRTKWAELCFSSHGEELLAEPRQLRGRAAYTKGHSRGCWAWDSMGQALVIESSYLGEEGRGLMRKRWDTVSLGFVILQVSPRLSGDG